MSMPRCCGYCVWYRDAMPDLDNYIKILLDGMTGHAWVDDAQIVQYEETGKWYVHGATESPHVEVTVWNWAEYAGMGESR